MISLEVNGQVYSTWTDIQVETSLESVSGVFKFSAVTAKASPFPIKPGQPCTVLINNKSVIKGFVDKVNVSYDANSHSYIVEGRDQTCDIIDGTVDHKIEFKGTVTLKQVIETTLQHINCSHIKVIDNVPDAAPFSKTELIAASIGENAFEFIEKYSRKRQVLLTTDGEGNVVITRASTIHSGFQLLNEIDGQKNTIKKANVEYNDSLRFNSYKFWSQGNPGGHGDKENADIGDTDSPDPVQGGEDEFADPQGTGEDQSQDLIPKELVSRTGEYVDSDIRPSRVFNQMAESSSKNEDATERAKWEGQLRKAKSREYSCLVVGHSGIDNGSPYKPNTLVSVRDDFVSIHEDLIITKVTSRMSLNEGSCTELTLVSAADLSLLLESSYNRANKKQEKRKNADLPLKRQTVFPKHDSALSSTYKKDPNKDFFHKKGNS